MTQPARHLALLVPLPCMHRKLDRRHAKTAKRELIRELPVSLTASTVAQVGIPISTDRLRALHVPLGNMHRTHEQQNANPV